MPKAFSAQERDDLRVALRREAIQALLQRGVRKTTVDDLVRAVHIPKGTFYLLYPSKEVLLFEALTEYGVRIQTQLMDTLRLEANTLTPQRLTELLFLFYKQQLQDGMAKLMVGGELDALVRKLPDDMLAQQVSQDDHFFGLWREVFPTIAPERIRPFSAAFRALFFTGIYTREIGDAYDEALRVLIHGLVLQLWEESDD